MFHCSALSGRPAAGKRSRFGQILDVFDKIALKLHNGVIKQLDKYRRHCLWRCSDLNSKKPSKVAWPLICTPKNQGGLGVLDPSTHNDAMLLKFLHKFFSQEDIPWVKLIWFHYYNSGKLPGQHKKGLSGGET
jgi:hypothetical protein